MTSFPPRMISPRHAAFVSTLAIAAMLAPALPLHLADGAAPIGMSRAIAAESFTIDKLEIPTSAGAVTLTGIRLDGSSLGRSQFEGMFKAQSVLAIYETLAKLDASQLSVDAIEWHHKVEKGNAFTQRYEKFVARSIRAGKISEITITGGRQTQVIAMPDGKTEDAEITFGASKAQAVDLAGIAEWFVKGDPTGKAPLKQLYGPYEIASMTMKMRGVNTIAIGRAWVTGFKARLTRTPATAVIGDMLAMQPNDKDPAKAAAFISWLADAYAGIEMGSGGIDGMTIKGVKPGEPPFDGRIGKIVFNGGAKPSGSVSDIEIKAADGAFRLKKAGAEGDLYGLTLVAVQKALASEITKKGGKAPDFVAIPLTDTRFYIEGIDADLPPGKNATSPDRVKFSLAGYEISAGGFVGYAPTKIGFSIGNFRMPIPADTKDNGLRNLREIGLTDLDLSAKIDANWQEATTRVSVKEISVDVARLARLAISGELSGVPKAFFEDPVTNWPMALGTGAVHQLSIAIDDRGGLNNLLAKAAKDQGKAPEAFRVEVATMGPAIIGAFMSDHPDAARLADAVSTFLKGLKGFSMTAKSVSPQGLSVMELANAGANPQGTLKKVRIEATGK